MVRKPLVADRLTPALLAAACMALKLRAASARMYWPLPTGTTVMVEGRPWVYAVTCLPPAGVPGLDTPPPRSAAHVFGPTMPSATSPFEDWNCFTAPVVFGPKSPSAAML